MKRILIGLAAVAVLTGFAAFAAEDKAVDTTTFKPGWRHEQMLKAAQDGKFVPGPMMGWGRGPGPGAAAFTDGKFDPSKLPEWCPMRTAGTK